MYYFEEEGGITIYLFTRLKKIDLLTVFVLLSLLLISIFLVHSATINDTDINISASKYFIIYFISILGFVFASLLNYRILLILLFIYCRNNTVN
ncbi:hypothetical protein J2Z66_006094 [Paenibacillus eucommiae]|uniref:Uncharacterized protein n=1 Tax=Paenibacillus eucommiae TaxID=1355755 RepID=A0ABS4J3R3_9BACL|nr:hypothetical protein [Paenibacillus eucommiae]